jgi:hypothetical protein
VTAPEDEDRKAPRASGSSKHAPCIVSSRHSRRKESIRPNGVFIERVLHRRGRPWFLTTEELQHDYQRAFLDQVLDFALGSDTVPRPEAFRLGQPVEIAHAASNFGGSLTVR